MEKTRFAKVFITIMMCATAVSLTSCADREDGESNASYELRNTINGPAWRVWNVKKADGTWTGNTDFQPLWFEVKFSASKHNFQSDKFYYDENGNGIAATQEKYTSANNTAYDIKSASVIEGTVDGKPYFRITLKEKVTGVMHCDLYFYKENKTFEVKMMR